MTLVKRPLILVGLGPQGGNWWTEALADSSGWEVAAFVDPNPLAVEAHRAETGLPASRYFGSFTGAAETVQAEACVLATPSPAHPPLIEQALGAGLHVVVEKPFALDLAEAARLTEIAEDAGLHLVVSQQYRFAPVFQALAREIGAGRIGTPELATVSSLVTLWMHSSYGTYHLTLPHMHLFEMSVHLFDVMRYVFARNATRVYARSLNPSWSWYAAGGGACSAVLEFEDGPVVTYVGSFVSQGRSTGFYGDWRVEGPAGCLEVTAPDPTAGSELFYTQPPVKDEPELLLWSPAREKIPPSSDRGELVTILDQLGAAVDGGPPPDTRAADNLHTLAICDACRRSVEEGRPVDVWRG